MADYTRTIAIRMPHGTYERIEEEISVYKEQRTVSEFMLDAAKWYLDYRENMRIECGKLKNATAKDEIKEKTDEATVSMNQVYQTNKGGSA